MSNEAEAVFDTLQKAFERPPEEQQLSFYLHRVLIGKVPLPVVEREIFRAADEQFVRECWQAHAGRQASPEEFEHDVALCGTSPMGRGAVLRRFVPGGVPGDPLAADGEAFIRAAWRSEARREPTAQELEQTRLRIYSGELSKRALLRELGAPATAREKLMDVPVLGRLLRTAALIWNLPAVEREIAALRHRTADNEEKQRLAGKFAK